MTYFSTIYKLSLVAAVCFIQGKLERFANVLTQRSVFKNLNNSVTIVYSWRQPLSGVGMLVCSRESRPRRRSNSGCEPGKIPASRQHRCTQWVPTGSVWHQPWQDLLCNWWVQRATTNRTLTCLHNFIHSLPQVQYLPLCNIFRIHVQHGNCV